MIVISVAPTVIGMFGAFAHLQTGEDGRAAAESGVQLAFNPIFMLCGAIGLMLVIVGLFVRYRSQDAPLQGGR